MGRFVSDDSVSVFLENDPENKVFIRSRMNQGVRSRVQSAMLQISTQANVTSVAPTLAQIRSDIGSYNLALLIHNITSWVGPDFDSVPCDREHIEKLDPQDPLLDRVLEEITNRNLAEAPVSPPAYHKAKRLQ